MAAPIDPEIVRRNLKSARIAKGWTLERLSIELFARGYPTSNNKLWRLENDKDLKKVDAMLVAWLSAIFNEDLANPTSGTPEDLGFVRVDEVLRLVSCVKSGAPFEPSKVEPGLLLIEEALRSALKR